MLGSDICQYRGRVATSMDVWWNYKAHILARTKRYPSKLLEKINPTKARLSSSTSLLR